MKKFFLSIVGILIGLVLIVLIVGSFLPEKHSASVKGEFDVPIQKLWTTVSNFSDYSRWRGNLQKVEVLSENSWRETNEWDDTITFQVIESVENKNMTVEIVDKDLAFGGQWVYQIDSLGVNKTGLSITENGEIYNLAFRFMARFVFGYTMTMEEFVKQLEKELK